ncbi:uncharacterized protein EDB93DRAFT_1103401 [Suillus bovinus]|uniref:uncharacterized protein n=1 Tax=Suillus bovinus TaxID=48563 RepID=UPI001B87CFD7|nr:uncharacterized protein EDB93DRAFT_1103401 [Suillus bovinus]KAG2150697.1 hypothetical protein EDB93DRAFT_1103401 [Suillus bovinus]
MANVTANDTWTSVLNVFGDVIFVHIQNSISVNNTYCFNLNLDSPGTKKIVFRIRKQADNQDSASDDSETESESESEEDNGGNRDNTEMKTEDAEIGINEVKVEDEDPVIEPEFVPIAASPCNLLVRRAGNPDPDPENPTAPWSYYVTKSPEALEDQDDIPVDED